MAVESLRIIRVLVARYDELSLLKLTYSGDFGGRRYRTKVKVVEARWRPGTISKLLTVATSTD